LLKKGGLGFNGRWTRRYTEGICRAIVSSLRRVGRRAWPLLGKLRPRPSGGTTIVLKGDVRPAGLIVAAFIISAVLLGPGIYGAFVVILAVAFGIATLIAMRQHLDDVSSELREFFGCPECGWNRDPRITP